MVPSIQPLSYAHARDNPQAASSDAMQWSIWSIKPDNQYRVLPSHSGDGAREDSDAMVGSTFDTLQIHQVRSWSSEHSGCGFITWVLVSERLSVVYGNRTLSL